MNRISARYCWIVDSGFNRTCDMCGVIGWLMLRCSIVNSGVSFFFGLFAVIATLALAFLLLPMCQYVSRPCTSGNK